MKKYSFLLLLTGLCLFAHAQAGSEWFRQKQTKINYLIEQMAALRVYSDQASKGYKIAKQGLTNIGNVKRRDLTVHRDYFTSLRDVNPVVKHSANVGKIIFLQEAILKFYQQQKRMIQSSTGLTADDVTYVDKVLTHCLAGYADIVEELIRITTDNGAQMKDNERIARMDVLYADMLDRYVFIKSFTTETSVLLMQRQQERSDIKTSRSFFGVHESLKNGVL